jgi:NADH-quinone oxidoreductase subunit N
MAANLTMTTLYAALPELFLAVAAMLLLMIGVFARRDAARQVSWLALVVLAVTFALIMSASHGDAIVVFNEQFRADDFGTVMKALVLIGSAAALLLSVDDFEREGIARFEYPVLVLFATLGMLMMVSAHDLMALYIGLELQSLALYVMASIRRDSTQSTEAGLKYFVLGALSSGILLFGASLIYGFAGTTNFQRIAVVLAGGETPPIGLVIGLVFVIAGLSFKVSAVPFHMWTPDVYEGAPTPVTAFFAAAPKIAAFALFIRVLVGPFGDVVAQWQPVVSLIAGASMILGALAAIGQSNIKRLLAYSSIGHMGYALVGLASGVQAGVTGIIVYLAIYMVSAVGMFACVVAMRRDGKPVETIGDLAGLSRNRPGMAALIAIFMFSMAGIPPLAGFFAKFYVFMAAIEAKLFTLAVIGMLSSAVGAFYYLRIVKLMYFDEPAPRIDPMGRDTFAIGTVSALVTLLLFVALGPFVDRASVAAAALFPVGG